MDTQYVIFLASAAAIIGAIIGVWWGGRGMVPEGTVTAQQSAEVQRGLAERAAANKRFAEMEALHHQASTEVTVVRKALDTATRKLDAAEARVAELTPLADIGRRRAAATDAANQRRKDQRAAAPKARIQPAQAVDTPAPARIDPRRRKRQDRKQG